MTARAHHRDPLDVTAEKRAWRRRIVAARRALPAEVRAARAAALAVQVPELAAGTTGPVCAYIPVGTEPGSVAWVDALRAAGHEVLLPVVPDTPGPLDWAPYEGPDLLRPHRAHRIGLREPTGSLLGPQAIGLAGLVLAPGLAVDRRGIRLGQGGGYYDRSLPLAAPGTLVVVVLNPEELVDELPAGPHDQRVAAALLAGVGVTALGNNE